jgi:hypothetical protein
MRTPRVDRYMEGRPAGIQNAGGEDTMATAALGLLSVDLWPIYLATITLALRLYRPLWFSDRLVVALARPRPPRRL